MFNSSIAIKPLIPSYKQWSVAITKLAIS